MTTQLQDIYIIGSARTPNGAFLGSLSSLSAVELGIHVTKAALERSNVDPNDVSSLYLGNVLSSNLGQHPARQVALGAGLPSSVPCTLVNKVCASGMKAIALAYHSLKMGEGEVAVAVGTESMSNAPHLLPKIRTGIKFGGSDVLDSIARDGLQDAYDGTAMGLAAEACAKTYRITREEQDAFTIETYARAQNATKSGAFKTEIAPIQVSLGRGKPMMTVDEDESVFKSDPETLRKLAPAFIKDGTGTVTAASSSGLADGASAVVLCTQSYLDAHSLPQNTIVYRILSTADAAKAPVEFTTAPSLALPLALSRAGLDIHALSAIEINEAFSVVAIANARIMHLDQTKVNVHGGSVALGHPLGCSGARIVVSLMGVLRAKAEAGQEDARYGAAAVCNGGGGASAIVLERISL